MTESSTERIAEYHGAAPLDLGAIEAAAKHATAEPETEEGAGYVCAECRDTFYLVEETDPTPLCNGCVHGAAEDLGVDALALVARVRELEAERDRLTKLVGALALVYRRRDAYHLRSMGPEWKALEDALAAVEAIDPLALTREP